MMQPTTPYRPAHERERLHSQAERRWRRLADTYPELSETIAYGRGLVALYIDDLPAPATLDMTVERARQKLDAGLSLLTEEDFDVDVAGLRHFFYRLCTWASRQPALAEGGLVLERALLDAQLSVERIFDAVLAGDDVTLEATALRLDVPAALVQTLAGYTVVAALMSTARPLGALLTAVNHRWEQANCPACGGPPLLAELLGERADRWLRCATCGTGWHFPIDRCIHCGTDDTTLRETLSVGEQQMPNRVELCRHCRGYLKLATVPVPTPSELLTIVDMAFVALDEAARDQGYNPAPAR
jgi:formate dehydrogenase maturation protein FdhE